MKVNMTSTFTDQAEVHRGESSESGDPTMAFLAALGGMLAGPTPTPLATASGVAKDAAATVLGKAVAGSTPVDPKAGVIPGLAAVASISAEALLATPGSTPTKLLGQPMIAADRAGSPANGLADGTADGKVATPKQIAALSVDALMAHVITTTSEAPDPGAALANATKASGQPVIAADRVGVPVLNAPVATASVPTATLPMTQTPNSNLHLEKAPAIVASSIAMVPDATVPMPAVTTPVAVPVVPATPVVPVPSKMSGAKQETRSVDAPSGDGKASAKTSSTVAALATPIADAPVAVTAPTAGKAQTPKEKLQVEAETEKAEVLPEPQSDRGSSHAKSVTVESAQGSIHQADPTLVSAALAQVPTRSDDVKSVAAQTVSHPEVTAQIAPFVASLRHGPEGTHQMTVVLHPADLGQVQVVVEMRNGTVHLQLTGAHEAARDALTGALPQLRRELSDSGLSVGRTDVMSQDSGTAGGSMTGGGSGQGGWLGASSRSSIGEDRLTPAVVPEVVVSQPRPAHAGGVDVTI